MNAVNATLSAERADAGHTDPQSTAAVAYRKPLLQRLGVWNLFTRNRSPESSTVDNDLETGFFEFDFGR